MDNNNLGNKEEMLKESQAVVETAEAVKEESIEEKQTVAEATQTVKEEAIEEKQTVVETTQTVKEEAIEEKQTVTETVKAETIIDGKPVNSEDLNAKGEPNHLDDGSKVIPSLARIFTIFISPIKTLKSVKAQPRVLVPLLVGIGVPMVFFLLFGDALMKELFRNMAAQGQQMPNMQGEVGQVVMNTMKYSSIAGVIIGIPLSYLFSSAIIMAVNRISGRKTPFKKIFSMVATVGMIAIISYLINTVLILTVGESSILSPITSAGTLFTDGASSGLIYYLLAPIDILAIWAWVLTYFGLVIVADFSKKMAGIYITVFVILTFLGTMSGYFFNTMMGM